MATLVIALGIAVPWSILFMGFSLTQKLTQEFKSRPTTLIMAGLACALSLILFLWVLQTEGTGLIMTLRNVSIVFALLFSIAFGERPPAIQISGVFLVLCGAVILALK